METIPYTYDSTWKDKLTSYGGVTIQSDALGNVTSDGTWSYTWEGGRRLAGMSKSGTTVSFRYDENGQRIKKTVNGVTTEYTVQSKRVVHVKNDSLGQLHIYYDGTRPDMVTYNGATYRYVHSLHGDILGLQDSAGNLVVEYRYDAWGRQISKTGSLANSLGTLTPFRYRGYVYDEETSLYYLRSRYYNTEWGRFVSADAAIGRCGGINQHNLFAYCLNNVMNCSDANGKKVYVLNGINNTSDNGLAPGIKNFCALLENENVENIVPITTYWTEEGESVIDDLQEYWVESFGGTVYTEYVISEIERDLMQNPLVPGESINIVGYSGSGIIALEVAVAMQERIANVVLVGAPILYFEGNLKAKAHAFWSWGDILSWNITKNVSTYCVGISGHTEYFREDVVAEIAQIVR